MSLASPTDAERRLIACAAKGEVFRAGTDVPPDVEDATRDIDGALVATLIAGDGPDWPIHRFGVRVTGARIIGDVDLTGAKAAAAAEFLLCRLTNDVTLGNATVRSFALLHCEANGFDASELRTGGSIDLTGTSFRANVSLFGADIGGEFLANGAKFTMKKGNALSCDRMTVKGSVRLNSAEFAAEVRFGGAAIGGQFSADGAKFTGTEGNALNCDGMTVKGDVFLDDKAEFAREVRFLGADIGGQFSADGAKFTAKKGNALSCDGMTAKGDVRLDRAEFAREVRFGGAVIGGQFSANVAKFSATEGSALACDGMSVKGAVFLREAEFAGAVRFPAAKLKSDLDMIDARFLAGASFIGQALEVNGVLLWRPKEIDETVVVTLYLAKVGQLADHLDAWPNGRTILDGLVYERFASDTATRAPKRIAWLKRQPPKHLGKDFRPQPWEQLYAVLRREGHEDDAKEVGIEKQRALRSSGTLGWRQRLWNRILDETVRFGFRPAWSLRWILGFWLLGMFIFALGYDNGIVLPSRERVYLDPEFRECFDGSQPPSSYRAQLEDCLSPAYPRYSWIFYSLDVFLPIVDLHQETYWLPHPEPWWGWFFRVYFWFHILAGWFLTTIAVLGFTGAVKRE